MNNTKPQNKYFISYMGEIGSNTKFKNGSTYFNDLDDFNNILRLEKQLEDEFGYEQVTILFYKRVDDNNYLHNF